jgi:hypothetical protein
MHKARLELYCYNQDLSALLRWSCSNMLLMLFGTSAQGAYKVVYGGSRREFLPSQIPQPKTPAFSDSDHDNCKDTMISVTGFAHLINGTAFHWGSCKQKTVTKLIFSTQFLLSVMLKMILSQRICMQI